MQTVAEKCSVGEDRDLRTAIRPIRLRGLNTLSDCTVQCAYPLQAVFPHS